VDSIQLSIDTNGIPFQKEKQTSSTLDVVTIFVGTRNGKNTASTYYPWEWSLMEVTTCTFLIMKTM